MSAYQRQSEYLRQQEQRKPQLLHQRDQALQNGDETAFWEAEHELDDLELDQQLWETGA